MRAEIGGCHVQGIEKKKSAVIGNGSQEYFKERNLWSNYVYGDDAIYFHCAKEGHKMEGFQRSDKVSFCVVGEDEVIPEAFSTAYASLIVFGRASVVTDEKEKREALKLLAERFSPEYTKEGEAAIRSSWNDVCVVRLKIEHAAGKAGMERIKREEARYASFL